MPLIKALDIPENDIIYKFSDPIKVQSLAKKFLGNGVIIYKSNKPNKKYMVNPPGTKKWVHFGGMYYEDYTKHKDKIRRQNYLTRSAGILGEWKNDPFSANNLSRNLLW